MAASTVPLPTLAEDARTNGHDFINTWEQCFLLICTGDVNSLHGNIGRS
jgi:hypothetical protein